MGNVTSRLRPGLRLRLRVGVVALLDEINEGVLQRINAGATFSRLHAYHGDDGTRETRDLRPPSVKIKLIY